MRRPTHSSSSSSRLLSDILRPHAPRRIPPANLVYADAARTRLRLEVLLLEDRVIVTSALFECGFVLLEVGAVVSRREQRPIRWSGPGKGRENGVKEMWGKTRTLGQ